MEISCRSNGHNQWSASKMNKFPKTVKHPTTDSVFQSTNKPEIDFHMDETESAFACAPFPSYQGRASERPGAVKGAPLLRGEAKP